MVQIQIGEEVLPDLSAFEVHCIDVGQADCSLVLCDEHAMLIDGAVVGTALYSVENYDSEAFSDFVKYLN